MNDISTTTTTDRAADEAAVLDVLAGLYRAWAAGDADGVAGLYDEDAVVVMPGVFHDGREAIRTFFTAGFAGPLRGSQGVDHPQLVRFPGPDTAVIVSRAGIRAAGEDEVPAEREVRATWVFARHDGRWSIMAYANAPAARR